jgi:hypothetical protein
VIFQSSQNYMTSWNNLRTKFEERFKPIEDAHALLAHVTTMRKDAYEPM